MQKQRIGSWGEDLACNYLTERGYKIIKRNVRLGNQELDLVCMWRTKLVIVEVKTKTKSAFARAEDMMDAHKLRNLKWASYKLIKMFPFSLQDLRFDLVAIELDRVAKKAKIRHYKDII